MAKNSDPKGRLAPGTFLTMAAGAPFDRRLGHAAVRVLAMLSSFRNSTNNRAYPGTDLLASALGISVRAVQKQLKALEAFGYIEEVTDPKAIYRGSRTWHFNMMPKPSTEAMRNGASRSPAATAKFVS